MKALIALPMLLMSAVLAYADTPEQMLEKYRASQVRTAPVTKPVVQQSSKLAGVNPPPKKNDPFSEPRPTTVRTVAQVPPAPEAEQQPRLDPVTVQIVGADGKTPPTEIVLGRPVVLVCQTTGEIDFCQWRCTPKCPGLLVLEDGLQSIFSWDVLRDEKGKILPYRILCAASGPGGLELVEYEVKVVPPENLQPVVKTPPPAEKDPAKEVAAKKPAPKAKAFYEALPTAVPQWGNRVVSNNRPAESIRVAGSLRMVASRMTTGQIVGDPWIEAQEQCRASLGENAWAQWQVFFKSMADAATTDPAVLYSAETYQQVATLLTQFR